MGCPKIRNLYRFVSCTPEQIRGFNVPVNDALMMQILETQNSISNDSPRLLHCQYWSRSSSCVGRVLYFPSTEIFHNHKHLVILSIINHLEKLDDVGMSTLFHYRNFLADFLFCGAYAVYDCRCRAFGAADAVCAVITVPSAQHLVLAIPFRFRIIAFDNFHREHWALAI